MNSIEQLKVASAKSQEIVAQFTGKLENEPDVVAARTEELQGLTKNELIAMVIDLEKPKTEKAFKVEDIVRAVLEEPACAIFSYEQIAGLVHQVLPDSKTSSKSVASYASKKKADWAIVPREKITLTHEDLLSMAGNA